MSDVLVCLRCRGPRPSNQRICPHCGHDAGRSKVLRSIMRIAGTASVSMTLAACYGSGATGSGVGGSPGWRPPQGAGGTSGSVYAPTCDELSEQLRAPDTDGDGYCGIVDCDEHDRTVHSGATDVPGDGIDQNCDGEDRPLPTDAGFAGQSNAGT